MANCFDCSPVSLSRKKQPEFSVSDVHPSLFLLFEFFFLFCAKAACLLYSPNPYFTLEYTFFSPFKIFGNQMMIL
jgi:hypothetical protein